MDKIDQSFYLPPDVALMVREFSEGKEIGEPCGVDAMNDIFAWKRGFVNCWTGWPNDGKFESIENLIPTPHGFKKMLDIHPGDIVFNEKGIQCKVLRTTDIKLNEECYLIGFNDGSEIKCGADHLWLTYDAIALRSYYKIRTSKLKKRGNDQSYKRRLPKVRTTKEISLTMKGRDGRSNHAIQICAPVECEYKNLLINPYVLGAWLGDGDSRSGVMTGIDEQIFNEIRNSGFNVRKKNQKIRYAIDDLTRRLTKENLKGNKHIPVNYLFSSIDQRLSLLQGLMDTDGFISKNGYCEFCSCRENLANDVYALICSLGIKAGITKSDAKLYGRKTSNRYRITFKTTKKVFRLQRKVDRLPKKVDRSQEFRFIVRCEKIDSIPVKCIQVDSPRCLYLTSTSFIPTHNTTFFFFMALVKAIRDGWKWCIWSPEMISSHVDKNGKIIYSGSDIYDELIYMKTGKTPYKHVAKKYFIKQLTLEEYLDELDWMSKYFFVIYPKQREYNDIMGAFKFIHEKAKGIDGFLVDPFKSFKQEQNGRTDLVLDEIFMATKEFSIQTHSVVNFVAHPTRQHEVKEKDGPNKGRYKIVNQHMLAGGASWDNNMDGIYSIYRPERHLNVNDPKVHFINLKQRKALLVARRGICESIKFNFLSNRYFFDEICPIDGSFSKEKQKEMDLTKPLHDTKKQPVTNDDMPF